MKKLWIILFAVLVLSGCANEEPVETTTEAVTTTAETTPPGYYVPRSSVEKNSDGAVRMYQLPDEHHEEDHLFQGTGNPVWIPDHVHQRVYLQNGTYQLFSGCYHLLWRKDRLQHQYR